MIKFNWGTGIFIVIVLIFGGVIAFFIYSSSLDIHLVETNYYEKELVYEQKIIKMRNADNLPDKISIISYPEYLLFQFPDTIRAAGIAGTILFYRPADETKDLTFDIAPDDSLRQVINRDELLPGKYIIKIEWEMAGTPYFQEEVLIN